VLRGKKAVGVIDRSICFGWNCGPIYMEIRALTPEIGAVPMISFHLRDGQHGCERYPDRGNDRFSSIRIKGGSVSAGQMVDDGGMTSYGD